MAEITFYTNPMSRGRIVHTLLEELGVPYDLRVLSFEKKEHKSPEFLAVNPMGNVPAIVHRGVVVTETGAICLYLADAFPEAGLAPAFDDPQRGTYMRWFFFDACCFEPAIVDKLLARPPVEHTGALGYGTYEDALATLEGALAKGAYPLGERFSAVDVYVGSQIHYSIMTKAMEPTPVFQHYADLCGARPALQRVLAGGQ